MANDFFTRVGAAAKSGAPIGASVDIARVSKDARSASLGGKALSKPATNFFAFRDQNPFGTPKPTFQGQPQQGEDFWDQVGNAGERIGGTVSSWAGNMFGGRLFGHAPSVADILNTDVGHNVIRALEWGPETSGNIFEATIRQTREDVKAGRYGMAAIDVLQPFGSYNWFRDEYRNNYDKAVAAEASVSQTVWLALAETMDAGTSGGVTADFDTLLDDKSARDQRAKYFSVGSAHWTTGVGDAGWQLFMDPFWVGGKAAAGLKVMAKATSAADVAAAATRPVAGAVDAEKAFREAEAHLNDLKSRAPAAAGDEVDQGFVDQMSRAEAAVENARSRWAGSEGIPDDQLSKPARNARDLVNGVATAAVDHENLPTAVVRLSQTRWMANSSEGGAVSYAMGQAIKDARVKGLDRAAQIEAAEDVLYAGMGDANALAKLRESNAILALELDRMHGLSENLATKTLMADADMPHSEAVRAAYTKLNNPETDAAEWGALEGIIKDELEKVRKTVVANELTRRVGEPVRGAGRGARGELSQTPESFGIRARGRSGTIAHVAKTVEVGRFIQPITFVAGRHLPGTVKLADPEAVIVADETIIRAKRVAAGITDKAVRREFSERLDSLQADMAGTSSLAEGAEARGRIFAGIEQTIDEIVAVKRGLDPEQLRGVHNSMRSRREAELAEVAYQAKHSKDVHGIPRVNLPDGPMMVFVEDGKMFDEFGSPFDRTRYLTEEPDLVKRPVLRTQQQEFISMLDPYQLDRYAAANYGGGLLKLAAKATTSKGYRAATWTLDATNHIWKFFALLRPLAYLVRSQLDEQLRIAALVKTQQYWENTVAGAGNWLAWNRRTITEPQKEALLARLDIHRTLPLEHGRLRDMEQDISNLEAQRLDLEAAYTAANVEGDVLFQGSDAVEERLVESYEAIARQVDAEDEIADSTKALDPDQNSAATEASRISVSRDVAEVTAPKAVHVRQRVRETRQALADANERLDQAEARAVEAERNMAPYADDPAGEPPDTLMSEIHAAEREIAAAREQYLQARQEFVKAGDDYTKWSIGRASSGRATKAGEGRLKAGDNRGARVADEAQSSGLPAAEVYETAAKTAQGELDDLVARRAAAQKRADEMAGKARPVVRQSNAMSGMQNVVKAIGRQRQVVDNLAREVRRINADPAASAETKAATRLKYRDAVAKLETLEGTRQHLTPDARQAATDARMDAVHDYGLATAEVTRLDTEIAEMKRLMGVDEEVRTVSQETMKDLRKRLSAATKKYGASTRAQELERLIALKKIDAARQSNRVRIMEEEAARPIAPHLPSGKKVKRERLGKTELGRHLGMSEQIDLKGVKYHPAQPFDPFRTSDEFKDKIASFDTQDAIMGILYKTSKTEEERFRRTGEWQLADPTRRGWTGSYLRLANLHLSQDPISIQMARGASDGEVTRWLKGTPEGQQYVSDMNKGGNVPVPEIVSEARRFVDILAPDGSVIRKKIAHRQAVQRKDVYHTWDTQAERPTIPFEVVERKFANTPAQDILKGIQSIETGYFRAVAGWPAERVARQPLYVNQFGHHAQEAMKRANLRDDSLTLDQINDIRKYADRMARRDLEHYLFNTGTKSNGAHMFRLVSPFYAAWEDSMVKWARLFGEDPSRIARGWDIVRAPNAAGMVTDEDGNPVSVDGNVHDKDGNVIGRKGIWDGYVTVPTVADLTGWAGVSNYRVRKDSANVVFQGDPWWLPGPGPLVAIPTNRLVQSQFPEAWDEEGERKTGVGQILHWALPFGPSGDERSYDDLNQFAPAWVKATQDLFGGSKRMDLVFAQLYQEQFNMERRGVTEPLTDNERVNVVNNRVRNWALLRLMGTEMPVSMHPESPLSFYRKEYQRFRREFGADADDKFRQEYPEYQDLAISLSSNETGLAPTTGAYAATKKFGPDIARDPEFGWFFAGAENLAGGFNQAVYASQLSQTLSPETNKTGRSRKDPLDAVTDANVQAGWYEYHKMATKIDLALEDAGLTSLNQKGAQELKAVKDAFVQDLKERNSDWGDAYSSGGDSGEATRFLTMALKALDQHEDLASRSDGQALIEYVTMREKLRAAMREDRRERGLSGTGTINSNENAEYKAIWDSFTTDLYRRDIGFQQMFDRVLSSDDLSGSTYTGDE